VRNELPRNLTVLAVTTVACLLAVELGFSAYSGVPVLSLADWRSQHILEVEAAPFVEYDPLLGWKHKDNYLLNDSSWFSTLDYGVRKNQPGDDHIRTGGALVVGDSFAAGGLVKDFESWPAQLEQIIGIPVINGAVGSYGLDVDVLRAEQLLPIVRPKILIVGTQQGISLVGYTSFAWSKPYFTVEDGGERLTLHNSPVPPPGHNRREVSIIKRAAGHSYVIDFLMTKYAPLSWFSDHDKEWTEIPTDKVRLSCALLRRLKADTEHYGALPVLVLQHGPREDAAIEADEEISVARCGQQIGFVVVDEHGPIHALLQADPGAIERLFLREQGVFGHMTPQGNRLIAELVAAAIKEHEIPLTGSAEAQQ
jgi:hypothetical protein